MPTSEPARRPLMLNANWTDPPSGGMERYLRGLSSALTDGGGPIPRVVSVVSGTTRPKGTIRGARRERPVMVRLATYAWACRGAARGCGLIDIHFALYGLVALIWPSTRRLPLVVHFHGPWADESSVVGKAAVKVRAMRVIERLVYRRALLVVVLSHAFGRLVVERYGVEARRVQVISPGVDLELFQPGDRFAARRALGIDTDDWLVVAPRRLTPRTGLDVLIQATALLREEGHHPVVLVIGGGGEAGALTALAEQLSLGDRVRFLGRVSDADLVIAYQAADVVAVPSTQLEGFGLVVLEALACAAPVIVTEIGGLSEAVAGLPGCPIVGPGNARQLADALVAQRQDPDADGGRAKRRSYAETFAWGEVAERHRSLYRDLRSSHGRPVSSPPPK